MIPAPVYFYALRLKQCLALLLSDTRRYFSFVICIYFILLVNMDLCEVVWSSRSCSITLSMLTSVTGHRNLPLKSCALTVDRFGRGVKVGFEGWKCTAVYIAERWSYGQDRGSIPAHTPLPLAPLDPFTAPRIACSRCGVISPHPGERDREFIEKNRSGSPTVFIHKVFSPKNWKKPLSAKSPSHDRYKWTAALYTHTHTHCIHCDIT